MTVPSFADRAEQWSNPPVDEMGYISADELLRASDERLRYVIQFAERARYGGWRNYQGRWRRIMGLDSTEGQTVLDYGCGIGVEALQYAQRGNKVILADISAANVKLASRVLTLFDCDKPTQVLLTETLPKLKGIDVIHCAGVLHHIPQPEPIVEVMASWLKDSGELRLMLYSDEAWRIATGTEPPTAAVETDPSFRQFWLTWDAVGGYADWYNRDRLERRFGEWFEVAVCEYLTERREYLGAVLVKK